MTKPFFEKEGFCPICEKEVFFSSQLEWLRDHFFCSSCGSIPRERALTKVIQDYFGNYRELVVHESSPCGRGASVKLEKECEHYSASHYFPAVEPGKIHSATGMRCENLEQLTFDDASIDLFVTQDVMEHVFNPEKAFREIARILKPGGAHVFTVPIVNKGNKTERRADMDGSGKITYLADPEYHGNPIDNSGSLVTMHWGYDIAQFISDTANTPTTIVTIDHLELGIRAEYIDVLISFKP